MESAYTPEWLGRLEITLCSKYVESLHVSGMLLIAKALMLFGEIIRRFVVRSEPIGMAMIVTAVASKREDWGNSLPDRRTHRRAAVSPMTARGFLAATCLRHGIVEHVDANAEALLLRAAAGGQGIRVLLAGFVRIQWAAVLADQLTGERTDDLAGAVRPPGGRIGQARRAEGHGHAAEHSEHRHQ